MTLVAHACFDAHSALNRKNKSAKSEKRGLLICMILFIKKKVSRRFKCKATLRSKYKPDSVQGSTNRLANRTTGNKLTVGRIGGQAA